MNCPYCGLALRETAVRCKRCRNVLSLPADAPFALEKFYPAWGLLDVGLAYGAVFLITVFFYFPLLPLLGIRLSNPAVRSAVEAFGGIWSTSAMLLIVYFTVVRRYKLPFLDSLRLRPIAAGPMVVSTAIGVALAFAMHGMIRQFGISVMGNEGSYELVIHSLTETLIYVIYILSFGPVFEETLFRGLIYPALNRRLGLVAGVIVTSIGFAAMHLIGREHTRDVFVFYLVAALGITTVRALTRSTTAAICAHAGFNVTGLLFAFLGK